jgi:hypothetical protein
MANFTEGGGRVVYDPNMSITYLMVPAAPGVVFRQTKTRTICQPGTTVTTMQKFILAERTEGTIQQIGHFDGSDGVFLRTRDADPFFVRRANVTSTGPRVSEEEIQRSFWNLDRLDGTGPSGITLDLSRNQTLVTEIDWVAGRARIGFDFGGNTVFAHEFDGSNDPTDIKISNPNLPMRAELVSRFTNGAQMFYLGGAATTNLGYAPTGRSRSYTSVMKIAAGGREEVLALRMKAENVRYSSFKFSKVSVCSLNEGVVGAVIVSVNPRATGGATFPWYPAGDDSILEWYGGDDRGAVVGTGRMMAGGFATNYSSYVAESKDSGAADMLGSTIEGISDVLSLSIACETGEMDSTFAYTIEWLEYF